MKGIKAIMIKRLTNNNYIRSLLNTFLNLCIGLIVSSLITRYLGAELKGDYSYYSEIISIVVTILTLGLYAGYPVDKRNNGDENIAAYYSLFITKFIIVLAICSISSLLIKNNIYTVCVFLIAIQMYESELVKILSIENLTFLQKINAANIFVNLFLVFLVTRFTGPSIIYIFAISITKEIIVIVLTINKLRVPYVKGNQLELLTKKIKYGLIIVASILLSTLNYKLDILMLKNMSTSVSVGIYSTAVGVVSHLWVIPDAIKNVIYSKSVKKDNSKGIELSIKISLVLTVFFCICLLIFGRLFVSIMYGQEFIDSVMLIYVLCIGAPTMVFFKLISNVYITHGKANRYTIILFISVLLNFLLNLLLIKYFDNMGAAIASVLTYIFCGICILVDYAKTENMHIRDIIILNREDIHFLITYFKKK